MPSPIQKKRILWADYAKAFSILCVVLHHTQLSEPVNSLSYELCLGAFFALSGYFFPKGMSYGAFVRKRGKQLLLPYLGFAVLAYIVWLVAGRKVGVEIDESAWWEPLTGILIGTRDSLTVYRPLWFLTCLFVTENLFYLVQRLEQWWKRALILLVLNAVGFCLAARSVILPWGVTSALVMVSMYAIGGALREYGTAHIESKLTCRLMTMILCSLILFGLSYHYNPTTEISQSRFGNPFFFMTGILGAATLWIGVGICIERYWGEEIVLATIGSNTLLFMGLHLHIFAFIKAILHYLLRWDMEVLSQDNTKWLIWILSVIILTALSLIKPYIYPRK